MSAHDDTGNPAAPPQRRRSFLASRQDEIPGAKIPPVKTEEADMFQDAFPGIEKEEDIPLLTEVIPVGNEEAPVSGEAPPDSPVDSPTISEIIEASEVREVSVNVEEFLARMTKAINQQMSYELPTLVEATLLSASEDLRTGITSTMEAALRDFIARYKQQLRLPLDN
ncbi:hypothetical protein FACS1894158_03720 [Betaproteobacteria bacterium]|nr:hypothetical protein FACS1894158_03720 [Betaproteobacteria bacterium]